MNSLNREQQNNTERWESDFANLNFVYTDDYGNDALLEGGVEVVHNFITQLLSDARREERARCLEIVKGLCPIIFTVNGQHGAQEREVLYRMQKHNAEIQDALTTAEESIKKLK